VDTFQTLFLPGIFAQPTTFSRTLTFQSTTLEQPQVLAVFSDLQRDLFASPRAEDQSRHESGLSVTSLLLLDAGFEDARAGRVSPVPADWLLDADE
jgi:hypothetical protein